MTDKTYERIGRIAEGVGTTVLFLAVGFFLYVIIADYMRFNAKWGEGGEIDQIIQANKAAERAKAFEASLDNYARKNNNTNNW